MIEREDQHIEWKRLWKDEYLKWVAAFANSDGGVLKIGYDDDGSVVGVQDVEGLLKELPDKIQGHLGLVVDVVSEVVGLADTVVIDVAHYPYPISYKGKYYKRSGSTTQELRGPALSSFLLGSTGKKWDGIVLPGFGLTELNPKAMAVFRNLASRMGRASDDVLVLKEAELMESLHLIESGELKRSAALLFHDTPERFFPGAFVKIGYFKTDTDLVFQDEIRGPLIDQPNEVLDVIWRKYLSASIRYEGLQRVEEFDIPRKALREAVINALVHKDYSAGNPIQIKIYDDRIVIWNDGLLPDGFDFDSLKKHHASKPRNPDLANVYQKAGFIEAWGRGTVLMVRECINAGLQEPDFSYEFGGLQVVLHRNVSAVKILDRLPELNLGKHEQEIVLLAVRLGRISNKDIRERLEVSRSTALRYVRKLIEAGLLIQDEGSHGAGVFYELCTAE